MNNTDRFFIGFFAFVIAAQISTIAIVIFNKLDAILELIQ